MLHSGDRRITATNARLSGKSQIRLSWKRLTQACDQPRWRDSDCPTVGRGMTDVREKIEPGPRGPSPLQFVVQLEFKFHAEMTQRPIATPEKIFGSRSSPKKQAWQDELVNRHRHRDTLGNMGCREIQWLTR